MMPIAILSAAVMLPLCALSLQAVATPLQTKLSGDEDPSTPRCGLGTIFTRLGEIAALQRAVGGAYPLSLNGCTGKMSKDHAALRIEVEAEAKNPNRFRWQIYRGSEPTFIERAMLGYPTERAAYEAGQAALERILSHEALSKSKP
jgi:hypothetical protein